MKMTQILRFWTLLTAFTTVMTFTGAALAVDCNNNGVEDAEDIALGTSEDCQPNGVPDECDIADGTIDENTNGVPDECDATPHFGDDVCWGTGYVGGDPCTTNADCYAGQVCGNKSRYVSIRLGDQTVFDGLSSIHVESVSLKECAGGVNASRGCEKAIHCPGGACVDSPHIGDIWWAGPEISLPDSPNPPLRGSSLQCAATPHAQTWTTGVLHIYGPPVVPRATYDVRLCDETGNNCSLSLLVATSKWGDVVRPFGGTAQPNFGDLNEIIFKFRNFSFASSTPRADLVGAANPGNPSTPNQVVNFADLAACVDGFRGLGYAYTVPACWP